MRASSTMNTTDRFVRFAAEGEVMAKFSRSLERFGAALALVCRSGKIRNCTPIVR